MTSTNNYNMKSGATSDNNNHRVLIADPHICVRESLALLLANHFKLNVVGQTSFATDTVRAVRELNPSLLILDIALPNRTGLELLYELKRKELLIPCIILTNVNNRRTAELCLAAGAIAYILKTDPLAELQQSLRYLKAGLQYRSKGLMKAPNQNYDNSIAPTGDPLESLSPREREVFHLLADGLRNAQIAKKLFISPRTVETHRARIVRKLGMKTNSQIIRFAIRNGLSFA